MMKILFVALALTAGLSSCSGSRTMYLGGGTTKTVRLRETVKNVKVWVKDEQGVSVPSVVDLPEGGYFRADLKQ